MERRAFVGRTAVVLLTTGAVGCVGTSPSSDATETGIETTSESSATAATNPMRTATTIESRPKTPIEITNGMTPTESVGKRSANVSAAFVITDDRGGGAPDAETANARFEPAQHRIVVTGTIHVDGCGMVTFQSIGEAGNGTVVLVVGPDEYQTPDGTSVVCEHYTEGYRITLAVDGDLPETVKVVHRQEENDTFTLTP